MISEEFRVTPEPWEYLARDVRRIQSPQARTVEADYRFNNLLALIDSGEWEVDASNNVIPSSMSEDDKAVVLASARYTIISERPREICTDPEGEITWRAAGLIIGADVVLENTARCRWTVTLNGEE